MADRAIGIPIAREGLPFVGVTSGAAALGWGLGFGASAGALGALALFTAWFFRNPKRVVPTDPRGIVSPGDGKIVGIHEEFESRYVKDRAIRISIFLNVFDVHINRIPCQGTVEEMRYQPGQFLAANKPGATLQNEQNALMIRTAEGLKVVCVQVAGLIARRIVCWTSLGEAVNRGERFGLIRFGSRVDLFIPADSELSVQIGDRVKGGETLLGRLPFKRLSDA